jgi:transglutaminase/protease-like cytokinesis protein 3
MKKPLYLFTICFFLLLIDGIGIPAYGQKKPRESTDKISPSLLASQLIEKCTTERQKVTAIFRWVADNISYNLRAFNKNKNAWSMYDEPDDDTGKLKPLNERVAETVLRRRVAVCDGYSRLFKSLCDHAGIRSEVITGYARVGWNNSRSKFRSNHKWNAVFMDSSWYLLDVTWASGSVSYKGDEFIREYNNQYFLVPPDQFIRDHYPEDMNWALLKQLPTPSEFYQAPFHYTNFIHTGITSYSPAKGVIEAAVGDSIRFEVELKGDGGTVMYVADTAAIESDYDFPVMNHETKGVYNYVVTASSPEWLYMVCNGETILRYKLSIKKPEDRMKMLSSK